MKLRLATAGILLAMATSAHARLSLGPYFGMSIPVVNEEAKAGPLYGVQAKFSLFSWLAVGGHFQSNSYGNPSILFFEGTPNEQAMEADGGSVTSYAATLFLGKANADTGFNVYLAGSIGNFTWSRDNRDDINKPAYTAALGAEVVLLSGIGVEGRAMFEVVPTDNDGSIKSFLWFIGANYHFGL